MKNFAVIGNPTAHSRSPEIFQELFKRFGIEANYFAVSLEKVEDIIGIMKKYGLSGVNITSPFKEEVFGFADNYDPVAKELKAVNLIMRRKDYFYGFNTDVYGVQHSLIFNNVEVKGKKCIVVGSGGAGKSAVYALKDMGGVVYCCNRTDWKAEKISKDFDCGFIEYNRLKNNLSDAFLLILAVPEISQDIKDNLEGVIVFDANYRSSHLKEYCRRYIDGYEWLINQALKSFELFFDIKADARDIKKILIDFKAKRNIAVTGPTGSGKTAYGKNIADHYGMDFIDTDDETEKRTGMKISEIFQTRGEAFFRKIEEEIISDISENDNVIVSIGAGALSSEKNREIIKKNYFTILLDIDPDLANSRLNHTELSKRPLLFGKNLTEILDKMFKERKDHYLSVADIMIKISSNSAEHESGRIIKELDGR